MAPPEPGESANPFQFLLGDLMGMLGSSAPDQWQMTASFAHNVATGGSSEPNVEPVQRIQLEHLSRAAELSVVEVTGLPVTSDGRQLTCTAVTRGDWALRVLEAWRPVLTAMTPAAGPVRAPAPTDDPSLEPSSGEDPLGGLGALIGQWASAIGPLFFGLQIGSVIGHLSHRALGQYLLALPWPLSDELLVVTGNITSFAADWSLPEEEALLWICAHQLAVNTVLTRPALRERLAELLVEIAGSAAAAQQGLASRLGGLGLAGDPGSGFDLEQLQGMLGDPEELLSGLLTPEAQRTSDQLTSLVVVIDAYADHIAGQVAERMVGSHAQIAEAWYRRRIERGKGEEAAGALFGLDLDQTQVDRGRSFVSGVIERAGKSGLDPLWSGARFLPTPAEVDAPGLWLERISMPQLDEPSGG
ncbi:MAG: zinc-dependent metalloprotease [Acidimicrobiales bacterium]